MKLYKKAAACLLTAAMAISMLTACGGGGNGGNGGNGGGNTPSPLPNNPDQIILPDIDEGEGGSEGTGTKPTKTPIDGTAASWQSSTKSTPVLRSSVLKFRKSTMARTHVPSMYVLPGRVRTAM